jgi:hypothetical protein
MSVLEARQQLEAYVTELLHGAEYIPAKLRDLEYQLERAAMDLQLRAPF